MTLHIFADHGLMLAETAGIEPASLPGVRYTGYRQHKLAGHSARLWQALHILARPLNLELSAWFARLFNQRLAVEHAQLEAGLREVSEGDHVLWINPSLALSPVIEGLTARRISLSIYFLDPIHRLGLAPTQVRAWARCAWIGSYWPEEAAALGVPFLAPYAPPPARQTSMVGDLDVVYVGSPTPKRLLWLLVLNLHLKLRGCRGHLRLASRRVVLTRLLPGIFADRMPFVDYLALCARSRGVLELHERDAGGVTLRATLCQALQVVHLSNQSSTPQTVQLSVWRWGAMDAFLRARRPAERPVFEAPRLGSPPFAQWLHENFA